MESNDSPEIPDRGETSDIPGLPSGVLHITTTTTKKVKLYTTACENDSMRKSAITLFFFLFFFYVCSSLRNIKYNMYTVMHDDINS